MSVFLMKDFSVIKTKTKFVDVGIMYPEAMTKLKKW